MLLVAVSALLLVTGVMSDACCWSKKDTQFIQVDQVMQIGREKRFQKVFGYAYADFDAQRTAFNGTGKLQDGTYFLTLTINAHDLEKRFQINLAAKTCFVSTLAGSYSHCIPDGAEKKESMEFGNEKQEVTRYQYAQRDATSTLYRQSFMQGTGANCNLIAFSEGTKMANGGGMMMTGLGSTPTDTVPEDAFTIPSYCRNGKEQSISPEEMVKRSTPVRF